MLGLGKNGSDGLILFFLVHICLFLIKWEFLLDDPSHLKECHGVECVCARICMHAIFNCFFSLTADCWDLGSSVSCNGWRKNDSLCFIGRSERHWQKASFGFNPWVFFLICCCCSKKFQCFREEFLSVPSFNLHSFEQWISLSFPVPQFKVEEALNLSGNLLLGLYSLFSILTKLNTEESPRRTRRKHTYHPKCCSINSKSDPKSW